MTATYWYDKPFSFTRDAVFIGSLPLPGLVDADSVSIEADPDVPDQYRVTLTFVSGANPTLGRGVCLDADGRVILPPLNTDPQESKK